MNKNYDYLIGKKQNLLTVISVKKICGKKKPNVYSTMLECKCDCGKTTYIYPYFFKNNGIKSCGCIKHNTPYNATHKMSKELLYHIWESMRLRCSSPKDKHFADYGGRNIKVCDEWNKDFLKFKEWALNNGYSKGLTLDRINNNSNYSPDNCRWTTRKKQQRNRRNNVYITYKGQTKLLVEWCEELNLSYKPICGRIQRLGWNADKAFNTPIKHPIKKS